MEVHAHSHTARKKWTHYFWEFLMLFLAVFCGFLAEYQLEHKIEKDRVKEYAVQMIEGLRSDIATLSDIVEFSKNKNRQLDSIRYFLSLSESDPSLWNGIYRHVHILEQRRRYSATTAVFDQVNNSGTLRYFKNRDLIKKILQYKSWIDLLHLQDDYEGKIIFENATPFINRHFMKNNMINRFGTHIPIQGWNSTKTGKAPIMGFLNAGKSTMMEFQNIFISVVEASQLPAANKNTHLKRAEELINLLQKEYHLK
jgi:hypothetical protein